MIEIVFDSSALLAVLRDEAGGGEVETCLAHGLISSVNVTEIITRLVDEGAPPELALDEWSVLSVPVASFGEDLAFRAGLLRAPTRHRGLSLGDRACLALAQREGLPVLTADRAWADLGIGIDVRLIR